MFTIETFTGGTGWETTAKFKTGEDAREWAGKCAKPARIWCPEEADDAAERLAWYNAVTAKD